MAHGRVRAVAVAVLAVASGAAWSKDPDKSAIYAKDVEFLLDTLEKKAGKLLKQKDVDWKKVAAEFREEVKWVRSDVDHVKLCQRLIARLKDGHAALTDLKNPLPDESKGRNFTGPRVHLLVVGDKVYVRAAFGEAETAGVKTGMEVVSIDGVVARNWVDWKAGELRDKFTYSSDRGSLYSACHLGLADWSGTKVRFELKDGAEKKAVEIVRDGGPNYAPFGPVFAPKDVKEIGRQRYGKTAAGFGYIHLRDISDELPDQLDTMLGEIGDVTGLVLDMRANSGGNTDHEAVLGRFLAAGEKWPPRYVGVGKRNYTGPIVVIVDAGVASAGESVAGCFKEDGRAFVIGDSATHGMCAQKEKLPVPSGLFSAYFAVESNKGRFNAGKGVEGIGIVPHEVVAYDPAELAKGVDTQIRRAEELLKGGLPKGKVLYKQKK